MDLDLPGRIALDPERVEQGLARLVLSLIELLRRLMERQAIRRIDAGSLSDDEIERLGETFLKLDEKMQELKAAFGLQDDDLNINLGPLGDLM
ncbi:MAG TPA: gas vesicle protein K [Chloroflexota bacterium]|nr:gas vesicle protein K [Chloroflexota bacterium]